MANDEPLAQQLLQEVGWVRTLAARLAGPHGDDVAQEACVAAMRGRPDVERPLRPWLAAVVRKLSHTRARGEARRRAHEAAAERERSDENASPESRLVKAELLHLIGELVARLDEPYRSTILLRYYEGLTSQEIAKQQGIADGTVRWRLTQAMTELRRGLDQRVDGGRRAWSVALAALPVPHPVAVAKGASMIMLLKVSGVVAVAVLSGAALHGAVSRGASHATPVALAAPVAGPGGSSGAAAAKPKADPASDPDTIVEQAEKAYIEGRYDDAIKLAQEVKDDSPAKAQRIIGASKCFLQDGAGAAEAAQKLDADSRGFVEYVCRRNNVTLPDTTPVM